jgi:arsenate reductase (thioredoxin)
VAHVTDLPNILFVCTGNAGRSQMAQALFRQFAPGQAVIESAGVAPWDHLHPMAVQVLAARGVSLSGHYPKSVAAVEARPFDLVVTIGERAKEKIPAPVVGRGLWIHWDIADPADADGTPASEAAFRQTAEAITARLPSLLPFVARLAPPRRLSGKPGVSTALWRGRFRPAEYLPWIAQAGFAAIELCSYYGREHFDHEDAAALHELEQVAGDLGLGIWSIHSPDVGSLAAADKGERTRQLNALRASLELAERLGAKAVASHGLIVGPFAEDAAGCAERLAESLAALAPVAEASPAVIAFENDDVRLPGKTAHDVLRRVRGLSRAGFGFVLDTGHANIAGDLADVMAHVGDRLVSLHLNDNLGHEDTHQPPFEGSVDWQAVAALLRASRYSGCILYEINARGRDPQELLARTMQAHRRLLA